MTFKIIYIVVGKYNLWFSKLNLIISAHSAPIPTFERPSGWLVRPEGGATRLPSWTVNRIHPSELWFFTNSIYIELASHTIWYNDIAPCHVQVVAAYNCTACLPIGSIDMACRCQYQTCKAERSELRNRLSTKGRCINPGKDLRTGPHFDSLCQDITTMSSWRLLRSPNIGCWPQAPVAIGRLATKVKLCFRWQVCLAGRGRFLDMSEQSRAPSCQKDKDFKKKRIEEGWIPKNIH